MPATIRQRLIDLLAIGRVANLPTVWSNVIVGFLLAWSTADVFFLAQVSTDEVVFRSNLVALALLGSNLLVDMERIRIENRQAIIQDLSLKLWAHVNIDLLLLLGLCRRRRRLLLLER